MYRLLVLDIDDTITNMPLTVPDEIIAAADRAREAGIRVTLATGRGYFASADIVRQMKVTEPIINYGGAIISDPRDGRVIYGTQIPPELVTETLEEARELGIHAHIYQGDTVISGEPNEYFAAYTGKLGLPNRIDPDILKKQWHNVPKVLMMTTEERAEELRPVLQKKYAGRLKVSGSSSGFIELNHPSAHKGAGVAWLAEHLGIKREEVVAAGDNSLDYEMICWAGLGCAVGNAKESIRAAADMVLPRCDEFGVAWLIDNVLLK